MSDARPPRDPRGLPIPLPDPDQCPAALRERIDAYFAQELDAQQVRALFAALEESPEGRAAYDEAAWAARLLESGPEHLGTPSQPELDGVERAVLARIFEEEKAPAKAAPSRLLAWLGGFVAVGAALLVALPFLVTRDEPPTSGAPGFQARGKKKTTSTKVGLRLFCASEGGSTLRELPPAAEEEMPGCPLGAELRFAITNRSQHGHLFLVGADARRRPLWYSPAPPKKYSISIAQGAVDLPLRRSVRLKVNHQKGPLRVFAIFSSTPISADAVSAALSAQPKIPLSSLEILPIEGTTQRSLLIEVQ